MRRTVYLSFDLSKPDERACYKFLVDSDRAKKKIVCMLLTNAGLVNPKIMITDEELPKLKKEQNSCQKRDRQLVKDEYKDDVTGDPAETMLHPELDKTVTMSLSEITPTFPDGRPVIETEEDNTYSMFTKEQIQNMQEKCIDYEGLNRRQLQVLAAKLNEGNPYRASFTEASFTL